jgi:hypothetical protein
MCKETPVNRAMEEKKWRVEEEERHKKNLKHVLTYVYIL